MMDVNMSRDGNALAMVAGRRDPNFETNRAHAAMLAVGNARRVFPVGTEVVTRHYPWRYGCVSGHTDTGDVRVRLDSGGEVFKAPAHLTRSEPCAGDDGSRGCDYWAIPGHAYCERHVPRDRSGEIVWGE